MWETIPASIYIMEKDPGRKFDIYVRWKHRDIIRIFRNFFAGKEIMVGTGMDKDTQKEINMHVFGINANDSGISENNWKKMVDKHDVKWFIIIHFPKIDVENAIGDKTTVEDLYAAVIFEGPRFIGLEAEVATFSLSKALKGYGFSHMSMVHFGNLRFNHCCLGSTQLSKYVTDMSSLDFNTSNDDMQYIYMNIAQCVERYFTIESTTGTPYIRISNIIKSAPVKNIRKIVDYDARCDDNMSNMFVGNKALQCIVHECLMRLACLGKVYGNTCSCGNGLITENISNKILALFIKDITPIFKSVYNEHLLLDDNVPSFGRMYDCGLMADLRFSHDGIYILYDNVSGSSMANNWRKLLLMDGMELFMFNGKMVKLHIYNDLDIKDMPEEKYYLSPAFASLCLNMYNELFYERRKTRNEIR